MHDTSAKFSGSMVRNCHCGWITSIGHQTALLETADSIEGVNAFQIPNHVANWNSEFHSMAGEMGPTY